MPGSSTQNWRTFHPFARRRSRSNDQTEQQEKLLPTETISNNHRAPKSRTRQNVIFCRLCLLLLVITLAILLVLVVTAPRPILDRIKHLTTPEAPALPITPGIIEDLGLGPVGEAPKYEPPKPMKYNEEDKNIRKAIVFASFTKQDVAWLPEIPPSWEIYRYVLDDPNPVNGLPVPKDQGREAMAYLTFIIDHYHNLPNFTVFHHGHRRAWHQPEPTPMKLRGLNLTALSQDHYINFRCALDPGCTEDTFIDVAQVAEGEERKQAIMLPRFWNTMFGNQSRWDLGPPPESLSVPCCAQFAVTREAIQARPLEFWKSYRRPLERDLRDYIPVWGEYSDSYFVGICYEKLWHMVFGKPAIYCPSEDYCRKTQFSDSVVCDRYTGQYQESQGWEGIKCIERWQDG